MNNDFGAGVRGRIEAVMRDKAPPGILGPLLSIVSVPYSIGVTARNIFYDTGILRVQKAPVPVVSVGNLTVGGSGKTPFAGLLAKKLAARKPGILSRGYGGTARTAVHVVSDGVELGPPPPVSADEAYMLAKKLPGVPVVCSPNRLEGADKLAKSYKVGVIILDDGYQSRYIHRDVNILAVDASYPAGNGRLFPRGVLRESLKQAVRADLVALTGREGTPEDKYAAAAGIVSPHIAEGTQFIRAQGKAAGFADIKGEAAGPPEGPVFLFCGVANPGYVRQSLDTLGLAAAGQAAFADHHQYAPEDIEKINVNAAKAGARSLVTTEKDAVRLYSLQDRFDLPVYRIIWEMKIIEGEEILDRILSGI